MLTSGAVDLLQAQPWPGNVRQLRTVLVRAAMMSEGAVISLPAVVEALGERENDPGLSGVGTDAVLARARDELFVALVDAGWDTEAAARRYGVARGTIYRWMEPLGIEPRARSRFASLRRRLRFAR